MVKGGVGRRLQFQVAKKILAGVRFDPKPQMARTVR
jgi:hypothetical protein